MVEGKRRTKIPRETPYNESYLDFQRDRPFPSIECLTGEQIKELEKRCNKISEYLDKCRTPFQTADYFQDRLTKKAGFDHLSSVFGESKLSKGKLLFRDFNDGDAFVAIKEGKQPITEGINILVAHSDTPCLRIQPKPIRSEWDPDHLFKYPGVRLGAYSHGGLSLHQWPAQQVKIIGYIDKHGEERQIIELPGYIPDHAAHFEHRQHDDVEDAFNPDKILEIVIGQRTPKETLNKFNLKSVDDFTHAKLFGVPTFTPALMDEYSWRLMNAYGLDNRLGTYSALDALIRERTPKLTSLVYVSDNEEVGDCMPTGINGPFLEHVVDHLMDRHERKTNENLSERDKRKILAKSSLLYVDVNTASSSEDEADNMNFFNSSIVGFGVHISLGQEDTSSLRFNSKLQDYTTQGVSSGNNICPQLCGNSYLESIHNVWDYVPHTEKGIGRYIGDYCLGVGTPILQAHGPIEVYAPADEFWTEKYLRRFLEQNTSDIT